MHSVLSLKGVTRSLFCTTPTQRTSRNPFAYGRCPEIAPSFGSAIEADRMPADSGRRIAGRCRPDVVGAPARSTQRRSWPSPQSVHWLPSHPDVGRNNSFGHELTVATRHT